MAGAGLRQLNVRHDPLEDRLLLALTLGDDSEIRLWLTRRCTILLLETLDRIAVGFAAAHGSDPLLRQALADLAQGRALAGADLDTPFAGGQRHPLGEAPLLVATLQYGELQAGQRTTRLTLLPPRGEGVKLTLDEKLTHVLAHLLRQAARGAKWQLPAAEAAAAPAGGGRVRLH